MSVKVSKSILAATAIALMVSGAAFAGALHKIEQSDPHSDAMPVGNFTKAAQAIRTIEITMGDTYFEPEKLVIEAGETVRFVVTNEGEFLHEFNLGTAAMHAEHQQEMMAMVELGMLTPTGIDHDSMEMGQPSEAITGGVHDIPNSILVEPGKSRKLIWKFTDAADLEFACNLPGHYDAGMMGKVEIIAPTRAGS